MSSLRLGLLLALSLTLVHAEDEVIKCPGGECVKLHLCRDGEINTDGSNIIDIRFDPDDPCEHYLLKCCSVPDGEDGEIIEPPSSSGQESTGNAEIIPGHHPTTGNLQGELTDGAHQVGGQTGGSQIGGGQIGGGQIGGGQIGGGQIGGGQIGGGQLGGGNGNGDPNGNWGANGGQTGSGSIGGGSIGGGNNQFGNEGTGGTSGGDVPPPGSIGGNGGEISDVTQNPLVPSYENKGCGIRNADGVGFRITGNNDGESEYGEFPWMVAILKEEKALDQVINVYQCGGSLIHPRVVLTAAHCVQNKQPHEIKIRLGEWDTQTTNEIYDHQDRNVEEIVVHDKFYKGGLFNDVALLFLNKPAEIIDTVNTACLPPQDFNFDQSRCFASGWGKDVFGKDGKYQVILKKIELPIMPFAQCQTALRTTRLGKRFILNKSFICAGGEPGKDTCKGDGGSPLVCPIPGTVNRFYQAGIVAWGIGCGENGIPGVYVNVAGFRSWIDDHLTQRNIPHDYYIHV